MLLHHSRNRIQPSSSKANGKSEAPQSRATRPCRPRLQVEELEDRTLPTVNLLQNFPDINFNQPGAGGTPPDTTMAVGPNTVVGAVNTGITLTDKNGGARVGPVPFSTFFSTIFNGVGFSDPYAVYDDQANRFYVCILDLNGNNNLSTTLDFAVSKTGSPTSLGAADWNVFRISSVNIGNTQLADYPKMGWNNDAVFVSFNQFTATAFVNNLILSISKASILSGGPLTTFQTTVNTGSDHNILIPARMHKESAGNLEYFVQSTGAGAPSTMVNVVKETNYLSAGPTFTTTPITVNPYSDSPGVPGLTTTVDNRMLSVDWIDNGKTQHMVASGNVGVGGLNLARWYEFNAPLAGAPTLLQQGDINVGGGISTSYPAIAISPLDSIGMTFMENSTTQSTSMFVTGRAPTDPANTMEDPVLVKAGVLPIANQLRGGDYSATEYDPANPLNFWSANEYQFDNSGDNFHWGTQIAEFMIPVQSAAPPVPVVSAVLHPFRYVFSGRTGLFSGLLTALFTSTGTFIGPVTFVFPKLPRGVLLANATGTFAGFSAITVNARLLPTDHSLRVLIRLRNRRHVPMSTFYLGFPVMVLLGAEANPL